MGNISLAIGLKKSHLIYATTNPQTFIETIVLSACAPGAGDEGVHVFAGGPALGTQRPVVAAAARLAAAVHGLVAAARAGEGAGL